MPSSDTSQSPRRPRPSEQGNIALVTALLVMALAGVGIGMARFVQVQAEASTEMRLSNFAGTLALNVAESGVNQVLYNWSTGTAPGVVAPAVGVPGNGTTGLLTAFPGVTTSYQNYAVSSQCSYTVAVADAGANWTITVVATVTANGATLPSVPWRAIRRTVQATVPKGGPSYPVTGLVRS